MSLEVLILSIATLLLGVFIGYFIVRRRPRKRRMKTEKFEQDWVALQSLCRSKEMWPEALIAADNLLDRALKKKRFRGRSMGERLVSAQRFITDNDDVWDAHNLVKKIIARDRQVKLKESEVKEALISFKLALIDLGALPSVRSENS